IAVRKAVEVESPGEADGIFLGESSALRIIVPVAAVHKATGPEFVLEKGALPRRMPIRATSVRVPYSGENPCKAIRHSTVHLVVRPSLYYRFRWKHRHLFGLTVYIPEWMVGHRRNRSQCTWCNHGRVPQSSNR